MPLGAAYLVFELVWTSRIPVGILGKFRGRFQNSTGKAEKTPIRIFWDQKSQNRFFSNFFITKSSNFISNMNDDFYEASFEVYYIFVRQKLAILGFSPKIFFILTSVTSETS